MSLKGLIFDFDGLILDTELPEYQAWQEIYHAYGSDLPLEEWVKAIGSDYNAFDPFLYLEQRSGLPVDRIAVYAQLRELAGPLILQQELLPGVKDTLERGQQMGLRIGLASSSGRDRILSQLDYLGLSGYFDAVCTGDQVERVKPDPMLYQCALDKLGLDPREAVAFEDSPNGIAAAKAAGIFTVAVPNTLTGHLDMGGADLVVPSMAHLPLDTLLEKF